MEGLLYNVVDIDLQTTLSRHNHTLCEHMPINSQVTNLSICRACCGIRQDQAFIDACTGISCTEVPGRLRRGRSHNRTSTSERAVDQVLRPLDQYATAGTNQHPKSRVGHITIEYDGRSRTGRDSVATYPGWGKSGHCIRQVGYLHCDSLRRGIHDG